MSTTDPDETGGRSAEELTDDDLEIGDRVVDREQDPDERSAAVVLKLPGETASEYYIDAIGTTVAEVNPEYSEDSDAAVVAFEDALEHGSEDDVTQYTYPVDRLKPVSDEWDAPKSSGRRERARIIDEHGEAVDFFGTVLEQLLTHPETVTKRLRGALDERARPETRDDCRNSRDDEYRPGDENAICCWECSTDLPRPKKLTREDAAGPNCRTGDPDAVREVLADWVGSHARSPADTPTGVATDYTPWGFASDLEALQSDTVRSKRTAAVRLAYNTTLAGRLDEEYNFNRAVALLRDRGLDTDDLLPGGDRQ